MAKLHAKQRNALPDSDFAGPNRTYPIEDANHQKEALIQAARAYHEGRMSAAQYHRIVAAVHRKRGGK